MSSMNPRPGRPGLWSRLLGRPAPADDPGGAWAATALRPLRRQTIDSDVSARVLARIAELRIEPGLAAGYPRASRLAWVSSVLLAGGALAFLTSAMLVVLFGGDQGAREVTALGLSLGHVLLTCGRLLADLGATVIAGLLPLLRAFWSLLEIGAPFVREVSLLAAAGGVVSILVSAYVFASARKTAPRVNLQGGIR